METTERGYVEAQALLRIDWDAGGTVSVHLPTEVARERLRRAGWKVPGIRLSREPFIPPAACQTKYPVWELDEALTIQFVAEALS